MIHKAKNNPMTFLIILSMLGILYLTWYYKVDGILVNKPIEFVSYDPLNIPLEKTEYKAGEMVRIKVNFCKTRNATGATQWSMIDGRIIMFPAKEIPASLPIGCYPSDPNKTILVDVEKVPTDLDLVGDKVHFEGVGNITLSGGRVVKYKYRTQSFLIVE